MTTARQTLAPAGIGCQNSREHPHGCCLSGSVRADHSKYFSPPDRKTEMVNSQHAGKRLGQILKFYDVGLPIHLIL
jgi:hypothetical protein